MESVQARSIYIPKIDSMLRISTMEFLPGLLDRSAASGDRQLASMTQFVTGSSAAHFMSHSRWHRIGAALQASLEKPKFVENLRRSVAGSDPELREQLGERLEEMRSLVSQARARLKEQAAFSDCALRNMILSGVSPGHRSLGGLLGVSGYPGGDSVILSLYHDLRKWDEATISLWVAVADAALNRGILPSVKGDYEALTGYDIPFSGSPKIKPATLKQVINMAYGAGIFVLPPAGYAVSGALGKGEIVLALEYAAGGAGAAMVFVSLGITISLCEAAARRGKNWIEGKKPRKRR